MAAYGTPVDAQVEHPTVYVFFWLDTETVSTREEHYPKYPRFLRSLATLLSDVKLLV
jgi:hypothetical protein